MNGNRGNSRRSGARRPSASHADEPTVIPVESVRGFRRNMIVTLCRADGLETELRVVGIRKKTSALSVRLS